MRSGNRGAWQRVWARVTTIAVAGFTAAAVAATPALAQSKNGGSSDSKGNEYGGSSRTDLVSLLAGSSSAAASLSKLLNCSLLKANANVAGINLDSNSNGGSRAKVQIAGKTIYSVTIPTSGSFSFPVTVMNLFNLPPVTVVTWGPVSVKVSASAGGGATFSGTWNLLTSPPRADLTGSAKTWGNGTGNVTAQVLYGAASATVSAVLNFFNTTISLVGSVSQTGISNAHATFSEGTWQFLIKLKAKLLWVFSVLDKTLVDVSGSGKTTQWF